MKIKITGEKWEYEQDGVLFLVQRAEEMLNHSTVHLYKVPILNTFLLIKEYLEVNKLVKNEIINKNHLSHIMEEFIDTLKKDIVVKDILTEEKINYIVDKINTSKDNDKEQIMIYLFNLLKGYVNWCGDYLKRIVQIGKEKKKIEDVLKAYLSSLIGSGYSQEYIYQYLEKLFCEDNINPVDVLNKFIDRFDLERRKYNVYIVANKKISKFKMILERRIKAIFEEDEYFAKLSSNPKYNKKNYIILKFELSEMDEKKALEEAYRRLDIFFRYYKFLGHKKKRLVLNRGMIRDEKNKCSFVNIKSSIFNNVKITPNISENILGEYSDNLIVNLGIKRIFRKIDKTIFMHNLAMESSDLRNSFLNLWSVLEILCINNQDESKIDKIKNSILPILERDYLHYIFEEIHGYLNRYLDKNCYNEIKKELPDGDNKFKIACLVILDEYSNLREKIYVDLKRYPLIRSRISQINNIYKNPKEIEKDLNRFFKRIEWHINRLYRTRNAIIHSGENPNNLNLLTEHLHNYVDEVLLETMFFLVNTNLSDVSSIFINAKFVMDNIIKLLKKGEKLSEEDIQILMNVMFLK